MRRGCREIAQLERALCESQRVIGQGVPRREVEQRKREGDRAAGRLDTLLAQTSGQRDGAKEYHGGRDREDGELLGGNTGAERGGQRRGHSGLPGAQPPCA